ncbi:MAG TPA: S8 family serine peptidase [Actinomycetota bacterium]|nr:S8 family serine peptidase [Actinomycetota bacterium]
MGAAEMERAAMTVRRPRAWGVVAIVLIAALLPAGGTAAGRVLSGPSVPEASIGFTKALETLAPPETYSAFVTFRPGSVADHETWAEEHGLELVSTFDSVDAIFARGTVGAFRLLTTHPDVVYLEENRTLTFASDTSSWATRARIAQLTLPGGPYRDPSNNGLDGSGIGVALIDSGVNGTHNDLVTQIASHRTVVCPVPNPQTRKCVGPATITQLNNDSNSDSSSGHGTHIAGIITGTGVQSRGPEAGMSIEPAATYRGTATGSRLHVYAMGEANTGIAAANALEHLITNINSMAPRVRVVANSYADLAGSTYDANSVMSMLVRQLVEQHGVTFVFPAGNVPNAGTGASDQTSSFCKDPTPGVICVANYNDQESGSITGFINPMSARGASGNPSTHPDISAPGTRITSTCVQQAQPLCNSSETEAGWVPWYATLSGTSMAAGNVAGAVAMIYQARPSITPAQVESAIEAGARPIGASSFETGAGLLNLPGTLDALGVPRDDRQVPALQVIASDPAGDISGQPQAADLLGLSVTQNTDGTVVRYHLDVVGFGNFNGGSVVLRVIQNVNGRRFASSVRATSSGVFGNDFDSQNNNAPPTDISVSGNRITMTVPVSALGDPPNKAPAHNVFATSNGSAGAPIDMLPGGTGTEMITRPRYGDPYSIRRGPAPTQSTTPPPSETATATATATATSSTSFSPPPSSSGSPTPSASASRTPTPTPSLSPTRTVTPSPSASASATSTSTSGTSTTPPSGTKGATSVTLATSTSKTTYDRSVTLSGTVTRSAPCQGNLNVVVSRRLHGSQQLTPLSGPIPVSATSGSWGFETRVSNNASYVAEVEESSSCASSTSTSADVLVKVDVDADGPSRCSSRPVVTGKVRPNQGGTRVLLKQRIGGRSQTVDQSTLDSRSRFKLSPRKCRGTFKVKWPKQNERNEAGVVRL